jgi:hypothetical protein
MRTAAAWAAAFLAAGYAAMSAYWAAGGTGLLDTVGGRIAELGRAGGAPAVVLGLVVAGVKLAGAVQALALVQPWGRQVPSRPLRWSAIGVGLLLSLYGGANVALGALALAGVFGPPADPVALGWHVAVWDLWFLLWGAALLVAAVPRRAVAADR